MPHIFSRLVLICTMVFSIHIGAEEKDDRPPLKKYEGSVVYSMLSCKLSYKMVLMTGERNEFIKCIDDGKASIRIAYGNAAKTVKKPSAKNALKDHYIASLAILQGIEAQSDERKMNYEKRQGDNQSRLDELWIRFETEN